MRGKLDANNFANLTMRRDGLAQGTFGEKAMLSGGKIKENIHASLNFGGVGGI